MENKIEIWKDIDGHENAYQISNLGRVKSLPRKHQRREIILKPYNHFGYLAVDLGLKNNSLVHRLVAESFIPKIEGKLIINHKDSDKTNNNVENLEWVTPRENCIHHYERNPGTSKYVGVEYRKDTNKWRARIKVNGKPISLGTYKTEKEAHEAYQNKLKTL